MQDRLQHARSILKTATRHAIRKLPAGCLYASFSKGPKRGTPRPKNQFNSKTSSLLAMFLPL